MKMVSEYLASQVHKRNMRIFFLFICWCVLVVLDILFGIAKYEWIGLPVFIGFAVALTYLFFFSWPRCPGCEAVIYVQNSYSFKPYPRWVPALVARFFPKREFCQHCGLSFKASLSEAMHRAL